MVDVEAWFLKDHRVVDKVANVGGEVGSVIRGWHDAFWWEFEVVGKELSVACFSVLAADFVQKRIIEPEDILPTLGKR